MNKFLESIPLFHQRRSTQIVALVISLVILGVYAWMYHYPPLPDYWNTLVLDFLTILAALAAVFAAILLVRQFGSDEKPRLIWFWFSLGWFSWLLGELSTAGYDIFKIAYGDLSVFDIFWTLGYFCFGLALYLQFRHIYGSSKEFKPAYYILNGDFRPPGYPGVDPTGLAWRPWAASILVLGLPGHLLPGL